ncbi:hypothetical protein [Halomonas halocynthiae]|uniref:hypothetical protein n=1 Tax=Halomonas halocynthiae TaxID=176290 RepID=UPI0003FB4C42|nr:hypothetical protein [Halomonas halocynthiae]
MKKLIGGLLIAASLPAFADGKAVIQATSPESNDQVDMSVSWLEGNMRLDFPEQQAGYMLLQGDKGYMITDAEGQTIIMDISKLSALAKQVTGEQENLTDAASVEQLEATGETETIAGIEGEVYDLVWKDNSGNTHEESIVLSDNTQARELLTAFHSYRKALLDKPDPIAEALEERGMGMLRQGDSFLIVSINNETPDKSIFTLPEDGLSFEEMMQNALKND